MTYLALDVGARRIGVAVGSSEMRLATPLRVIKRGTIEQDATRLRAIAELYDAEQLVIGLPRELDGSVGAQAQLVTEYGELLKEGLAMPFEFFDERYSTSEALARQRAAGVSDKQGRATIDAVAAAVILQDFFDSMLLPPEAGVQ
jgi:putative Holliday junction resolvase